MNNDPRAVPQSVRNAFSRDAARAMALPFLFAASLLLTGCGGEEPVVRPNQPRKPAPAVNVSTTTAKKEIIRHVYQGDRYRDPFVPLNNPSGMMYASSGEVPVPNIGALTLKGIFEDGKQKTAIIAGGGISYILKGTQFYDNRQRLIKGITGIIKKDSVIMIAPDKTTKELKLRQKE